MENSKIAALVELGILCRGEPVEVFGDGAEDPGPYRYSDHNQLCRFEHPRYQHPYQDESVTTYRFFAQDTSMPEALEQTRLVVLLGVADSEALRQCVASRQAVVILFEPDERVLIKFLERFKLAELNRDNLFCFTGNPYSFNPALQEMLPGDMFRLGTPAFFMTDRIRRNYGSWAHQVVEYLEILHYRHAIYGLSGQSLCRSRPLRDIHRGLLLDQQVHVYENIPDYLLFSDISQLKNRLKDTDAILVAAGPELDGKLEYIRRNRDRAVVICVNNAVKPLVEAGIHPHFVVINDTSLESGLVFRHIPELPGTILVGHCLSDLGGDRFGIKYLFGSFLPQVFGQRGNLKLHGSVISTAFSLARHLGCAKCVLIGVQLASDNPWGLDYVKGSVKEKPKQGEQTLINKYPQLYPVTTPFDEQLYTTLNFRDAALWLAEEIRLSNIVCVNTSRASILYGPGISFEEEPELSGTMPSLAALFRPHPPRLDREEVRKYIKHELGLWTNLRDVARTMLEDTGPAMAAKGMAILDQLDRNNITYMVERHTGFSNWDFQKLVFRGDEANRRKGLRLYFRHVLAMSEEFLSIIGRSVKNL
ncbi:MULTISPECIES: 6-hydroxymethylpterin diphosphokinase MptE-like protein [unclassified Pseudodesulfovibrio]|uniref:motility associated factor glycosyltransferase family protein n=1 Tax=unclassified Pseudodesulfovibrio TaxID=2661612 RepID=UPI000FEBDFA1|nr:MULTISPECIES: 6-hydroxymethylpterin diphosphokinase MptE-like protein [unclassified Pseudodesulfovibrio]MCJ2165635.1 DUF115 domain-containing protein [Pseudodesulfovibrio sp. S3-i]RWU03042.1 DUF115 domain-containing protein [Pseudodesulfovibrio sp. S3]